MGCRLLNHTTTIIDPGSRCGSNNAVASFLVAVGVTVFCIAFGVSLVLFEGEKFLVVIMDTGGNDTGRECEFGVVSDD
jgi:hypothetical protein